MNNTKEQKIIDLRRILRRADDKYYREGDDDGYNLRTPPDAEHLYHKEGSNYKNTIIKGLSEWKEIHKSFVNDPNAKLLLCYEKLSALLKGSVKDLEEEIAFRETDDWK